MKTSCLVVCLVLSACGKKEEAAPAPSAAPPPPPAVSIAPTKEPEPPMTASAAPAAPAPSAEAVATKEPSPAAEPKGEAKTEAKKAPTGDLTKCCAAIGAAAMKGGRTKNQYVSAAAVCTGLNNAVRKGTATLASAKVTMKAQLAGIPVPDGC